MISVAKSFEGRAIKRYFYPDSVRNFTVQRLKCNIYIWRKTTKPEPLPDDPG